MEEKEKLTELDAETKELIKQAANNPFKKAIVTAFVHGLEMRAEIAEQEKTA